MTIPKIIHQIWFNFKNKPYGNKLPYKYQKYQKTLIDMNKDFKYILWDEKSAKKLIKEKYKWCYKIFKSFKYPVKKVDYFKYILMYEYGGIYLDMDIKSIKSINLDKINKTNKKVILCKHQKIFMMNMMLKIQNCVLMSEQKNEFWLFLLQNINKWEKTYISYLHSVLDILVHTGPGMLTNTYEKYNKKDDILLLESYMFVDDKKTKESYTIHLSDSTWIDKSYEKKIFIIIIIIFIFVNK
jgi:mannosyltransferase OCH1-like enzyme